MTAPNASTLWAELFVDELARAGLRRACLAPGSRSTPLTVAFARHPEITTYSLLDERGAAFFALGLALVDGEPAALVCTSGTAAANFYPAIIEANQSNIPLLLLTTDRPHELRHSGANQTIDQIKLYGDHVRWFVDVALPEAAPSQVTLRSIQTLAARAMAACAGLPPGPVHFNFPFRKPLEPTPDAVHPPTALPRQRPDRQPLTRISRGTLGPTADQVDDLSTAIQAAPRGVIVCGPRCPGGDFPAAVTRLAQATGYPILADALSGVRFGPHVAGAEAHILGHYETFLQPGLVADWPLPQVILRFGAMPISKNLGAYLAAQVDCQQIAVSENGLWHDDSHVLSHLIWADPAALCRTLAERVTPHFPTEPAWPARFRQAEQQASSAIDAAGQEAFFEGLILPDLVEALPADSLLFVASSLPVRHLDQFVPPQAKPLWVFANRGASGIDGTVASALGVAAADQRPVTLVIGDLAFYHDLNSLLALRRCGLALTIILINNNGGGIFHRLPISNFEPPFTELFVTPHGLDFEPAARMFGLDYVRPSERAEMQKLFQQPSSGTSRLIEIRTDAVLYEKTRQRISASLSPIPPGGDN